MNLPKSAARLVLTSLAATTLLHCGTETRTHLTGDDAPESHNDELGFYSGFSRWSNNINICFHNERDAGAADFANAKASIFSALESTWEANSALNFTLAADCPSGPPSGSIRIGFWNQGGGWCSGDGSTGNCRMDIGTTGVYKRIAVHEVGHGLGLPHEHQRMQADGGWEVPLCDEQQQAWDRNNVVITVGIGLCFENVAPPAVGAWSAPTVLGDGTVICPVSYSYRSLGDANSSRSDTVPFAFHKLTRFNTSSVMNYCNSAAGRASDDHTLTSLDALGIEIAYPYSLTRSPAYTSALFNTTNGYLAREDAAIVPEWKSRGATNEVFGVGINWRIDNVYDSTSYSFPLTRVPSSGSHFVQGTFTDIFSRSQQVMATPSRNYVLNTSLHSALVATVTTTY